MFFDFSKNFWGGAHRAPPQTPPPLFLGIRPRFGLRPQFSGASRPRFGFRIELLIGNFGKFLDPPVVWLRPYIDVLSKCTPDCTVSNSQFFNFLGRGSPSPLPDPSLADYRAIIDISILRNYSIPVSISKIVHADYGRF